MHTRERSTTSVHTDGTHGGSTAPGQLPGKNRDTVLMNSLENAGWKCLLRGHPAQPTDHLDASQQNADNKMRKATDINQAAGGQLYQTALWRLRSNETSFSHVCSLYIQKFAFDERIKLKLSAMKATGKCTMSKPRPPLKEICAPQGRLWNAYCRCSVLFLQDPTLQPPQVPLPAQVCPCVPLPRPAPKVLIPIVGGTRALWFHAGNPGMHGLRMLIRYVWSPSSVPYGSLLCSVQLPHLQRAAKMLCAQQDTDVMVSRRNLSSPLFPMVTLGPFVCCGLTGINGTPSLSIGPGTTSHNDRSILGPTYPTTLERV